MSGRSVRRLPLSTAMARATHGLDVELHHVSGLLTIFDRWPHERGDNYLDARR